MVFIIFSKLGRRQFEGRTTAKRIKAVVEETFASRFPRIINHTHV